MWKAGQLVTIKDHGYNDVYRVTYGECKDCDFAEFGACVLPTKSTCKELIPVKCNFKIVILQSLEDVPI